MSEPTPSSEDAVSNGISFNGNRILNLRRTRRLTDEEKRKIRKEVDDATALFLKDGGKISKKSVAPMTSNSGNNNYEKMFGGKWRG